MAIRLAIIGAALVVVAGVVNPGGHRAITASVGAALLLAAGVVWLVRRNSSAPRR